MSNLARRLITIFLSLFLISYVGYQAYLAFYNPLRTVRAQSSTVRDTISANAFVLHDETLIQADVGSGVIDYTREDGGRVPKGGNVATIYANAQDAQNAEQLATINDKIAALQSAGSYLDSAALDLNVLDGELGDSFLNLADAASTSDVGSLGDASQSYLNLQNEKQLATGAATSYADVIASMQQQAAALQAKIGGGARAVTSPVSGCFVSAVDGYEGMYDISKILSIRPDNVKSLLSAKPSVKPGYVGKVVSQYEWYITCNLDRDDALKLKPGTDVGVQFLLSSQSQVPATVAAVNNSGDSYAVVLKCEYMTSKLAVLRKQSIQIILKDVTGIRVSNDDIHIVNGQKGVYVLAGNAAKFKNIVVNYSGNGYSMSAIDSTDSKRLQVYDSIIENGDKLHDGKVIK